MKNTLFILFMLLNINTFAQIISPPSLIPASSNNNIPFQVPNSSGAVYTRTSNYEISHNRTVTGIVWHDDSLASEVYFSIVEQLGPGNYVLIDDTSMVLEPGGIYETKNADLSLFSTTNGVLVRLEFDTLGNVHLNREPWAYSQCLQSLILYQRRIRGSNDPWEIVSKSVGLNNNVFLLNTNFDDFASNGVWIDTVAYHMGYGKHPRIESIVNFSNKTNYVDKANTGIYTDYFDSYREFQNYLNKDHVVAWSNDTGYVIKLYQGSRRNTAGASPHFDPMFLREEFHLPYTFEPDYNSNETVHQIDVATAFFYGEVNSSGGNGSDGSSNNQTYDNNNDRVYAIFTDENFKVHIMDGETDWNLITPPIYEVTDLSTISGVDNTTRTSRVCIAAMRIQDVNDIVNHFVAYFDKEDGVTGSVHKNRYGTFVNSIEPNEIYSNLLHSGTHGKQYNAKSIASGIGNIGLHSHNRGYHIVREPSESYRLWEPLDKLILIRYAANYMQFVSSHPLLHYCYYTTPPFNRKYGYERFMGVGVYYGKYSNSFLSALATETFPMRVSTVLDNISNSTCVNTGRYAVSVGVRDLGSNNGIFYFINEEVLDLYANPYGYPY